MIIIGITGSIGMGKSTIAGMLKRLKIPVFDSDKEVKYILENDNLVKKEISDLWPDVMLILKNDKKVDKYLLSEKIFFNKKNRKKLEKIIHPRVQERRNSFIKNLYKSPLVALDVPLLYETGTNNICDDILLAFTNDEKQKERVLARPNMNEKKLNSIKRAQWSNERKKQQKPYLVTTSYGKFVTFVIVISYLMIIMFKRKILKL